MRALDLFAGGGGTSVGLDRAGFDVTGADIEQHSEYPFPLVVADAMVLLEDLDFLNEFDVIVAGPPCPRYSRITPKESRDKHPDLVGPVRKKLVEWGGIYVIENVPGAPLIDPVIYCGSSFNLRVRRHRLFESNVKLYPPACNHKAQGQVLGVYGQHPDRPGGWLRPNGTSRGLKATSVEEAQEALGIGWMSKWSDLADAIPPVYSEHFGYQLMAELLVARRAA